MDEDEYPSDSEQSDEDYCPDENQTENLSEVESDDNVDDVDQQENDTKSSKKRKKEKTSTTKRKDACDGEEEEVENGANESVEEGRFSLD